MRAITGILVCIIIVALGLWFLMNGSGQVTTYINEEYGFAYDYPASYSLTDYTPETASIVDPSAEDVRDLANVVVRTSETVGAQAATFEEFLFNAASLYCAADGPGASLSCTRTLSIEPFEAASGIAGTKMRLELEMREGETVSHDAYGPVYAFRLPYVEEGEYAAALFIPPLSFPSMNIPDTAGSLAETFRLTR